jgi:hypothetical protein
VGWLHGAGLGPALCLLVQGAGLGPALCLLVQRAAAHAAWPSGPGRGGRRYGQGGASAAWDQWYDQGSIAGMPRACGFMPCCMCCDMSRHHPGSHPPTCNDHPPAWPPRTCIKLSLPGSPKASALLKRETLQKCPPCANCATQERGGSNDGMQDDAAARDEQLQATPRLKSHLLTHPPLNAPRSMPLLTTKPSSTLDPKQLQAARTKLCAGRPPTPFITYCIPAVVWPVAIHLERPSAPLAGPTIQGSSQWERSCPLVGTSCENGKRWNLSGGT